MKVYTYADVRRFLTQILDEAGKSGEVRVRRRDGSEFAIRPADPVASPFAVPSVPTDVSRTDILAAIRESRGER